MSTFVTAFDASEKPTPELSGMICFVSTSKQGFIYNVFRKTEFLAHCTYTADTSTAALCNNLLYTVTNQALETYIVPVYAAVAKHVRTMKPSEIEDKLDVENDVVESLAEVSEGDVLSTSDGMANEESSHENTFSHHGFPVYDLEILQKVIYLTFIVCKICP